MVSRVDLHPVEAVIIQDFVVDTLCRAIKTVAQTAIASIGTAAVMSEVNWATVVSASVLAGALSLLTSVYGLQELEA